MRPTYNINGEPAPQLGRLIKQNALAMSEVLERLKKPDRVIVVSGSSPTGWKELTAT